jgi:hypothetical protein
MNLKFYSKRTIENFVPELPRWQLPDTAMTASKPPFTTDERKRTIFKQVTDTIARAQL